MSRPYLFFIVFNFSFLDVSRSTTYDQGWQLLSDTEPEVLARTWAKIKGLLIFSASRTKLTLFHAGVTEVKIQGVTAFCSWTPGSLSYQPTPNPSPLNSLIKKMYVLFVYLPLSGRTWSIRNLESKDWLTMECFGLVINYMHTM